MGDVIDLFPKAQAQAQEQAMILNVVRIEYRAHVKPSGEPCVAQIWITETGPHVAALMSPQAADDLGKGLCKAGLAAKRHRSYERSDADANLSNQYTLGNERVPVAWSFPTGESHD